MEKQLAQKTFAVLIHGKTGQEIEELWLDAGTLYTHKEYRTDEVGNRWERILVDGYIYEIERGVA